MCEHYNCQYDTYKQTRTPYLQYSHDIYHDKGLPLIYVNWHKCI